MGRKPNLAGRLNHAEVDTSSSLLELLMVPAAHVVPSLVSSSPIRETATTDSVGLKSQQPEIWGSQSRPLPATPTGVTSYLHPPKPTAQMSYIDVNVGPITNRTARSSINDFQNTNTYTTPHLRKLGWVGYRVSDGTVYYFHPIRRVTTDVSLKTEKVLNVVTAYLDNVLKETVPSGCELWLHDGNFGGESERRGSFGPQTSWVNHQTRSIVVSAGYEGGEKRKAPEEDQLDMEYRYWLFIEGHPVHTTLPPNAKTEAFNILSGAFADRLPSPKQDIPAPFGQDECRELIGLLRNKFIVDQNGIQARLVAKILVRVAIWRQTFFRPNKPLPKDAMQRRPQRMSQKSERFGRGNTPGEDNIPASPSVLDDLNLDGMNVSSDSTLGSEGPPRSGIVPGERASTPEPLRDASTSSAQTPSDLLKMLACILQNEDSQKHLCSLKGDHAQIMVDYLNSVLLQTVLPETWLRKHCLIALYKLSKTSLLYPHCYVLKESITFGSCEGGGTFSDIHRGRLGEKDLCLKVVRLHQKSDTDAMLKIYAKEAMLWGQLHHPNIIPFYGIYYVNEMRRQLCLVSPWMHRGNLVEYLKRNSSAPRTPFVYDVASGLEYLHSQGLVHSDLKGVNILVNDLERACITDFGLSFIRTDNTLPYAIASSMTHGFTHRWAAPELLEDGARPTMASDMWALGCVCYEILTGLLPFHDLGEVQIVRALISGKSPKRPNTTPDTPSVEITIWKQVDRCWSAEPDDRPKCLQFFSELQSVGLSCETPAEAQDDEREKQNYWAAIRKGGNKPIDLEIVKKILVELNTLTHISTETQDV